MELFVWPSGLGKKLQFVHIPTSHTVHRNWLVMLYCYASPFKQNIIQEPIMTSLHRLGGNGDMVAVCHILVTRKGKCRLMATAKGRYMTRLLQALPIVSSPCQNIFHSLLGIYWPHTKTELTEMEVQLYMVVTHIPDTPRHDIPSQPQNHSYIWHRLMLVQSVYIHVHKHRLLVIKLT